MKRTFFLISLISILLLHYRAFSDEKWEFNIHYGTWSINLAKTVIENSVGESVDEEIRNDIFDKHPGLQELSYNRDFDFDSSGNNIGFEIRYYPAGQNGSFSFGFSVEKTKIKVSLQGNVSMDFTNNSYSRLDGSGEFVLEPLSYNLSFRWNIFPSSIVHPYIGFGFGIAPLNGNFKYEMNGRFYNADTGTLEIDSISDNRNLNDIEDIPLKIIPILQLNLGLKGRISKNVHLHIDGGMWNGLLIRGGISIRI
ncbi:MAG: hypothetical protein ACUVUG_08990 [Candidatus Aminicenantia bacterium]